MKTKTTKTTKTTKCSAETRVDSAMECLRAAHQIEMDLLTSDCERGFAKDATADLLRSMAKACCNGYFNEMRTLFNDIPRSERKCVPVCARFLMKKF